MITLKELARRANVSVATVSKAFHDADDISEDTKKHIFTVAKQLGCFGKYYKGKYHKKIVAILCPELRGNHYSSYVECLRELMEHSDCIPIVAVYDFNARKQAELLEYFASYLKVDGVLVMEQICDTKIGFSAPVVSVFSGSKIDCVNVNLENAMLEAVRVLKDLGHTRIAFIGEGLTGRKKELFCRAMKTNDLDEALVYESKFRFEEAGEDGIRNLTESGVDFSAVICAYDNIAIGAIRELERCGRSVPDDISVIGIDNISFAKYMGIPLTSVDTNPKEVCMIAWDLLQKKMESPYYSSTQNITINAKLVVRESVGKKQDK